MNGVATKVIYRMQRDGIGSINEPRGVAIYLTRMIRSDGLIDICKDYNLKRYSSASSIVENAKKKLLKDRKFRNRVNELTQELIKSQPEI
jgi:chromosomal replication initiation ATPase DnaA